VLCATGTGDMDPNNGYKNSTTLPGTRCGEITGTNGGIVTNICSRKGDSGGPLFSELSGRAYGILNGGTAGVGNCPTTSPGSEWSQYSPLSKIFTDVNTRVGGGFTLRESP
jgi:streptogrisin C